MQVSKTQMERAMCATWAALILGLTGCAPVVIGSGAVVGAMVAADRRTAGSQLEDQGIELRTRRRISEALGDRGHINVTSYNRQVLLTGEVPTAQLKAQAEQVAQGVDNVQLVVNELAVMGNSSFSERSSDTFITGKVRAALLEAKDVPAKAFKVVTERSQVYLLGRVTEREAQRITEIARSVNGVRKVVRMFEPITEEELQQMAAQAPVATDTDAAQVEGP